MKAKVRMPTCLQGVGKKPLLFTAPPGESPPPNLQQVPRLNEGGRAGQLCEVAVPFSPLSTRQTLTSRPTPCVWDDGRLLIVLEHPKYFS